jgi:hypothetical protein
MNNDDLPIILEDREPGNLDHATWWAFVALGVVSVTTMSVILLIIINLAIGALA